MIIPTYYEADKGTFWDFSSVASKGYMQHKWRKINNNLVNDRKGQECVTMLKEWPGGSPVDVHQPVLLVKNP